MVSLKRSLRALLTAVLGATVLAGCLEAEIRANQEQLERQRTQLEKLEKEVESLRQQQTYASAPPPAGSCDAEVAREATRRGGESFAVSDFTRALGYYQDAVTACPSSAEGEINLARTYEALHEPDRAIAHYRRAGEIAGTSQSDLGRQAREAISRLSASK